ncbi:hypothetical protein COLU111180_00755 [Cohnella lubricantis]|uniref:Uncharacterized protein n=1 Tax=Cohnella lubricantis TaxID=2163172 RepID=A0A841TER0_9BACL|nr:hypothetical protein [Cohnella lubricantis]MBB6679754.1 hypothetical protein [Cohnella lubricantis]MBP2119454.1 hypothetical protein [Cohnella lubricantis]
MAVSHDNDSDALYEGKERFDMDIDRMVNEGLGGGQVTMDNGLIGETTTDTMKEDDPK